MSGGCARSPRPPESAPGLVIHHFGSKDGLRQACDDYIAEEIRSEKSETIRSTDPATWLAAAAEIESFAPMMAYLVRSMQTGGELAKNLWRTMFANVEGYLDEGVRAGTVKPSRDPAARARYLGMAGGGASCSTSNCTTPQRICEPFCTTTPTR